MLLNVRAGDVPELIRKTAEEFCGVFYDGPRSDKFRKVGMTQKAYVRKYWGNFVQDAIEVLSGMLGMEGFDPDEKQEIYDALISFRMIATETTPKYSLGRWK